MNNLGIRSQGSGVTHPAQNQFDKAVAEARRISRRLKPSRRWERMRRTEMPHPEAIMWENTLYQVSSRYFETGWPLGGGPWAQLGICSLDGEPRHDWRDFQSIKNDILGPEWEALELFPAESRLLDPSNYYILWAAPAIPLGKFVGRTIVGPEDSLAPQRGWAAGTPTRTINHQLPTIHP